MVEVVLITHPDWASKTLNMLETEFEFSFLMWCLFSLFFSLWTCSRPFPVLGECWHVENIDTDCHSHWQVGEKLVECPVLCLHWCASLFFCGWVFFFFFLFPTYKSLNPFTCRCICWFLSFSQETNLLAEKEKKDGEANGEENKEPASDEGVTEYVKYFS